MNVTSTWIALRNCKGIALLRVNLNGSSSKRKSAKLLKMTGQSLTWNMVNKICLFYLFPQFIIFPLWFLVYEGRWKKLSTNKTRLPQQQPVLSLLLQHSLLRDTRQNHQTDSLPLTWQERPSWAHIW